ncbi:ABC transporter ATP-binding protein [Nocardioides sp. Bht2]|uniref:ABC transporter ATP-binding protein n=1 Tax=Nocardioides sp. Bht2 TaxID=3392297 RepID=UPI0039B56B95
MLQLDDVSVRYGTEVALDRVGLHLPDGQVLAVLGPSGCGKSTLLRAVAGLEPLTTGSLSFDGADLRRVPTHRRGFALMFQDGQLFASKSVAQNIGYPLRLRRRAKAATTARVEELLDLVGLGGYGARRPETLSGGERQRVALARALAVEPRLLLLDEPLSALDAALRERLALDLRRIITASGTTTLMVTHDHEEAFAIADRMALMRDGRVVQEGEPAQVWANPVDAETALFLGYDRVLEGVAARTVLGAAGLAGEGPVALRRSALEVAADGPLEAVVRSSRAAPEVVRLVVEIPSVGEIAAVATTSEVAPGPGLKVRLRVVGDRLAVIGKNATAGLVP